MLSTVLLCASPALAWGGSGHRIVALIAEHYLTPQARAGVQRLLSENQTLEDIANWADEYRQQCANTGPWHYVNIPLDEQRYAADRYCPGDKSCVIRVLEQSSALLADAARSDAERRYALHLLVHFAGDLHQPLHSGDRADRGGNDMHVRFEGRAMSLHVLWDAGLIDWTRRREREYAELLLRALSPGLRFSISQGPISSWALQAKRAARRAYADLPEARSASEAVDLDAGYARSLLPVVDRQLARAGVRLAALLNDAFARPGPAVDEQVVRELYECVPRAPRRRTKTTSRPVSRAVLSEDAFLVPRGYQVRARGSSRGSSTRLLRRWCVKRAAAWRSRHHPS